MSRTLNAVIILVAAWIGLVVFGRLSDGAARLLIRLWVIFGPLCVMALLNELGRGVARRGGGLPLTTLAALGLRGAMIGLVIASLVTAAVSYAGLA